MRPVTPTEQLGRMVHGILERRLDQCGVLLPSDGVADRIIHARVENDLDDQAVVVGGRTVGIFLEQQLADPAVQLHM